MPGARGNAGPTPHTAPHAGSHFILGFRCSVVDSLGCPHTGRWGECWWIPVRLGGMHGMEPSVEPVAATKGRRPTSRVNGVAACSGNTLPWEKRLVVGRLRYLLVSGTAGCKPALTVSFQLGTGCFSFLILQLSVSTATWTGSFPMAWFNPSRHTRAVENPLHCVRAPGDLILIRGIHTNNDVNSNRP